MGTIRLAMIGCGAVAEIFHLPTIAASDRVELAALVEKSEARLSQLANAHNPRFTASDHRDIVGKVDAAIVAVPNHLHARVTLDLLDKGIHVLVEKPMALRTTDCDAMIEAATAADVVLAVGQMRRFIGAAQFVKNALDSNLLGDISRFDLREGAPYGWKVTSDAPFRADAGGGLLADIGIHVLDLLLWWLGDFEAVKYADDALGGVEAECEIDLTLKNGAGGIVELSRTRSLRNSYIISGERGTLELATGPHPVVKLHLADEQQPFAGYVAAADGAVDSKFKDLFPRQLDDFASAVLDGTTPLVPGEQARKAVELVETCYASRHTLHHPWVFPETRWQYENP